MSQKKQDVTKAKVNVTTNKKIKKEMPLSHKQIMFCEEYIKTQNATQSYLKVYTGCKEHSAKTRGSTLLSKVNVKAYIQDRLKPIEKKAVADADEILQLFTEIARGNVKDQMGFDTRVIDRIAAAKELAKRCGLFIEPDKGGKPNAPRIKIEVVDNSDLEVVMYEADKEGSDNKWD